MTWTPREDRLLATYRGRGMYWSEVAELLVRTELDVRQRAGSIEFPRKRLWAPDEDQFLQDNWETLTGEQLAATLRRSISSVRGRITNLALSTPRRRDHTELTDYIRARHAEQWTDAEISRAWTAEHADWPATRRWIQDLRRGRLGLPSNGFAERFRKRVAAKTREQCQAAGVASLAEIRGLAYQQFGARKGWPGVFRPRLVQVLNLLYEHGPHTREQIAAAIGMPWESRRGNSASRRSLKSNGKGGSPTAELMRAGLVVDLGRRVKRQGSGKSVCLYAIAPGVKRRVS